MCGIAGIVDPTGRIADRRGLLQAMAQRLAHRGPDDQGFWELESLGVGLAHRRLSIVDLSSEGHQPMLSRSGRMVIVFNGEIYNYKALRKEVEEAYGGLRSNSDTEVFLAAVEVWGLMTALARTIGMFAFALFDTTTGQLHLARDRIGKKPLYWGNFDGTLAFASEIKALLGVSRANLEIDRAAVASYFRHNFVPAPFSVFREIRKLLPGTVLTVDVARGRIEYTERRYWSPRDAYASARTASRPRTFESAVQELETLLRDAVALRMIADVPLGAFLSGGIDSTTIVALMQAQSSLPVRTFTIGFMESDFDEAQPAREVARFLGTDHTELYVTPRDAREVIPLLPQIYDEPFADSSQIPTYLVSRLARQHVKVALSGDGGDEVFLGYERYTAVRAAWGRVGWLPAGARVHASRVIAGSNPAALERWLGWLEPLVPSFGRQRSFGQSLQKAGELLGVSGREEFYRAFVSHEKRPEELVLGATEAPTALARPECWLPDLGLVEHASLMDMATYLPDDILVKVDRASMAVSLEARAPLLDHRVIEFALSLPMSWKLKGSRSKRVLRAVLDRHVPRVLVDRKKVGFGVPIRDWLRGPLRPWLTDTLAADRIRAQGMLNAALVERYVTEHLDGTNDWHSRLWDLLMFQTWFTTYVDSWPTSSS